MLKTLFYKDPIIPIFLFGLLLFAGMQFFKPKAQELIEVQPETVQALIRQEQELMGVPPDSARIPLLIESYIDDEVLLREAYRRGLDRNDSRVRKRILGMMRYSLDQPVPTPSAAQLKQFYEERKEDYRIDESVTIEQVFFLKGSPDIPGDPAQYIEFLEAYKGVTAELGDTYLTQYRVSGASQLQLTRAFGEEFAQTVFNLDSLQWQGPINSMHGVHYIYPIRKTPERFTPFEAAEPYLQQEYEFTKRRASQQERIEEMRKEYKVVLPPEYAQ